MILQHGSSLGGLSVEKISDKFGVKWKVVESLLHHSSVMKILRVYIMHRLKAIPIHVAVRSEP